MAARPLYDPLPAPAAPSSDAPSTSSHGDLLDESMKSQKESLAKETEARKELEIPPSTSTMPLNDGAIGEGVEAIVRIASEEQELQSTEVSLEISE